jgi:hypothetical protein
MAGDVAKQWLQRQHWRKPASCMRVEAAVRPQDGTTETATTCRETEAGERESALLGFLQG